MKASASKELRLLMVEASHAVHGCRTAEVVHIDLGIAFEQGRLLSVPERVPFRMTRDVVDGFGISGAAAARTVLWCTAAEVCTCATLDALVGSMCALCSRCAGTASCLPGTHSW